MNALTRMPSLFSLDPFDIDSRASKRWSPALNVHETDTAYVVEAEIPGIPPELVDLSVSGNVLTLKGEKQREVRKDDDKGRSHLIERSYGSFVRKIRLPTSVDVESAKASVEHGILKISLRKRDLPQKIKIDINPN